MALDLKPKTIICSNKRCEAVLEDVEVHRPPYVTNTGARCETFFAFCSYCNKETIVAIFEKDGVIL